MGDNWLLPAVEWLRLWAGFGLPMLLIGHLVSTRVAMALHGYEPSQGKVVTGLVGAGCTAARGCGSRFSAGGRCGACARC